MKITSLTKGVHADSSGWTFSIDFENEMAPSAEYRTNNRYEGLWIWQNSDQNWSQIKGCGQFSLSSEEAKAKNQIAAFFSRK